MELKDIFETFNYTTDIKWEADVGHFYINNQHFSMNIRPASFHEKRKFYRFFADLDQQPNVGNVDFHHIDSNGNSTQDLTGLMGRSALKVYAVVAQGAKEQRAKYGFDIFLCIAKDQKRAGAYEDICNRIAKKNNMYSAKLSQNPNEAVYAVFDQQFSKGIADIQKHLK